MPQAAFPQDSGSNLEEILAREQGTKNWINSIIKEGRKFLPAFISTFRLFVSLRDKFRTFEGMWKDFLPIRDLAIPRLQAAIELSEGSLVKAKLVNEGGNNIIESWYVTLTARSRVLEEIQNEIAKYSPSIDTFISSMLSDAGIAFDFEEIKEEDFNETEFGSRLDELGKVVAREKQLGILASLRTFIEFARDDEKESEKTLQAAKNMMNTAERKMRHTPCPPMEEVNNMLTKLIAYAKKMKEKGRIVLEDHLM